MSETIGESLGVILALFEEDLSNKPDDADMLDRIHKISDIYQNFTLVEFFDFRAQFEKGYASGKADIAFDKHPHLPEVDLDEGPRMG